MDDLRSATEGAREARLRRAARRHGYRLHRSRWRLGTIDNDGGFSIIDRDNRIVAAEKFTMNLDDVERWLAQ